MQSSLKSGGEREMLTFKVKGSRLKAQCPRPQKPTQLFHEIFQPELDWAFINGLQGHHDKFAVQGHQKINMRLIPVHRLFCLWLFFFFQEGERYGLDFNAHYTPF